MVLVKHAPIVAAPGPADVFGLLFVVFLVVVCVNICVLVVCCSVDVVTFAGFVVVASAIVVVARKAMRNSKSGSERPLYR